MASNPKPNPNPNPNSKVFREYTSDDSFTKLTPEDIPENLEIQVALTFARDYDDENNPTQGKFSPFWDRAKVTPEKITSFKTKYPAAKVLVSIGNDNEQFPFKVDEDRPDEWVRNATESLTGIINFYHLDGIDVNYEEIHVRSPAIFVRCIGELIKNLKERQVITEASISPNAAKNAKYYYPLYLGSKYYIDNVAYQCFTGPVEMIMDIVTQYNDPKKVLLGYSSIPEDWTPVSPPVFFIVLHSLLRRGLINGASLKVKLCSIANLPPKWILEVLCFIFNLEPFQLQAP